jgi:hypothetical protein
LQYKDPPLLKAIVGPSLSQKILITAGASPNNRARGRRITCSNRSQIGNIPLSSRNLIVLLSSDIRRVHWIDKRTDHWGYRSSYGPVRDRHLFISVMTCRDGEGTYQESSWFPHSCHTNFRHSPLYLSVMYFHSPYPAHSTV